MRRALPWLTTLLLLLGTLGSADAQPSFWAPGHRYRPAQHQGSIAPAIGAGIGLGAVGFLVGGWTAYSLPGPCEGEDDRCVVAAFWGAAAGGTFGMALGVHLGNHRRGNLGLDFLTAGAVWGLGIGIALDWFDAKDTAVNLAFVTIPIAQLAATVAVERAVGRARLRDRDLRVSVVPHGGSGATLAASVAF